MITPEVLIRSIPPRIAPKSRDEKDQLPLLIQKSPDMQEGFLIILDMLKNIDADGCIEAFLLRSNTDWSTISYWWAAKFAYLLNRSRTWLT